ncbi:MAG TPA: cyclic 2,3-diphosphoglycerate synthase [Ktedonobacterales bacterium]|jgi:predicted GTPase
MANVRHVVIMGAAGRDFHNFNVFFRGNPAYRVVAFTATQIPNIEGRLYPAELAGEAYPDGIPIATEDDLPRLIHEHAVNDVVFAYSDVPHAWVMHRAAIAQAAGASFWLLGPHDTMLQSSAKVIAICAVRTGSGKSQTSRAVTDILRGLGVSFVVVRHPMPYGDLRRQEAQRFATYDDLATHECTIEEREEYEPHLDRGTVVYAGVDYDKIMRQAEQEATIIVWDGGNNDFPFYRPDLTIVVADPLRQGHELAYWPGEVNVRMADVIVINKEDAADPEQVQALKDNIAAVNPRAAVVDANSRLELEDPDQVRGKQVLCIEDGPTITHGEMPYGAATVAAHRFGAAGLADPRPHLVGSLQGVYQKYGHLGLALPAMGYGADQTRELQETINATPADVVLFATPIDLGRLLTVNKPLVRVRYELEEIGGAHLEDAIKQALDT